MHSGRGVTETSDGRARGRGRARGPAAVSDDPFAVLGLPTRPGLSDDDVQAALRALPPEYRAAVVLCDIEGFSYEEIAATLGVKLGTVRSRIHRGRAQLRAALEHRRAPASHGRTQTQGTGEP